MKELKTCLNDSQELSNVDMGFLADHFNKIVVTKGTVLYEEGDLVNSIYFIAEGILHRFNYNDIGEKKTFDLQDGPCFCTDLESFSEGKRADNSCVVLTDCTLYVLTKDKYDSLVANDVKWSNFAKGVIEKTLIRMFDRIKSVANKSTEERYLDLVRTKPFIVQNVSLQIIASYLGTSRETLHRIRRKALLLS